MLSVYTVCKVSKATFAQGQISETEVKINLKDSPSNDPTSPQDTDLSIICFWNLMSDAKRGNCCYSWAVLHLASSSRGVSAHFVVRVVVIALESAPADTAESSNSSTKHRSIILKLTPERRVEGDSRWEVVANEFKILTNDKIMRARICVTKRERRRQAQACVHTEPKSILGDTWTPKIEVWLHPEHTEDTQGSSQFMCCYVNSNASLSHVKINCYIDSRIIQQLFNIIIRQLKYYITLLH